MNEAVAALWIASAVYFNWGRSPAAVPVQQAATVAPRSDVIEVKGYRRKDGVYVRPHVRRKPAQ